jgi:CBS domain-containing protein
MEIRPATTIDADERFDKALKMIQSGTTTLFVLKDGKYAGILTDRALTSLPHQPEAKVMSASWKAPTLNKGMELDEIAVRFAEGYRELAVIEKGKLLGMVRQLDILELLKNEGRVPKRRVNEIMSSPLITIDANSSLAQAASLMRKNEIHHLVVTDDSKYAGIISSSDVQPMLEKINERLPFAKAREGTRSIPTRSVLSSTPKIHSIRKAAYLNEAVEEMIKLGVSTLLVYDGKPLGLVHSMDIIRSSLPSSEPQLEISGLTVEEQDQREDIRRECMATLKQIGRVMPIEFARLTVKAHSKTSARHKYSLHLMVSGKHTFETSAFNWKLFTALNEVLSEMERKVMQTKDKEKGKRSKRGRKRASFIRIHTGEIYPGKPVK